MIAPTIAMMADGNQKIARKYMMAAGIPTRSATTAGPTAAPTCSTRPSCRARPRTTMRDGALFDAEGDPVYCQFMSMHWGVNDAAGEPAGGGGDARVPDPPDALVRGVSGGQRVREPGRARALPRRPTGSSSATSRTCTTTTRRDTPFGQIDGPFQSVGGSEPAYSLPEGDSYKGSDIVMITEAGTPIGVNDVWMTGFVDGICPGPRGRPGLIGGVPDGGQGQLPRRPRVRRRPVRSPRNPDDAGDAAVPQLAVRGAVRDGGGPAADLGHARRRRRRRMSPRSRSTSRTSTWG